MALTEDELRIVDATKLELLVANVMAAKRTNTVTELDRAFDELVDFQAATPFPDLQLEAAKARAAASRAVAKDALADLAEIAERTAIAGAGFKAAAQIAASGKKELLFPALASASAISLELITQFQEAIDAVEASVENVEELGDVPDAVSSVVEALQALKEKVKAAA